MPRLLAFTFLVTGLYTFFSLPLNNKWTQSRSRKNLPHRHGPVVSWSNSPVTAHRHLQQTDRRGPTPKNTRVSRQVGRYNEAPRFPSLARRAIAIRIPRRPRRPSRPHHTPAPAPLRRIAARPRARSTCLSPPPRGTATARERKRRRRRGHKKKKNLRHHRELRVRRLLTARPREHACPSFCSSHAPPPASALLPRAAVPPARRLAAGPGRGQGQDAGAAGGGRGAGDTSAKAPRPR